MNKPHVTEGIYSSLVDAEKRVEELSKVLPHEVTITGITID